MAAIPRQNKIVPTKLAVSIDKKVMEMLDEYVAFRTEEKGYIVQESIRAACMADKDFLNQRGNITAVGSKRGRKAKSEAA